MLRINDLYKSFALQSPKPILQGISITLEKGDFCVVIGSNGSGKSTLLKTILGEYLADHGEIFLNNQNISRLPMYLRAQKISCVFQDVLRGTIGEMTVAENLSLALMRERHATLTSHNKHNDLFMQRLSLLNMGLEKYLRTPTQSLSGGQRQAIAFIMATLCPPELLLLDEHCSALDPKSSQHIMASTAQIIQQLNISTLMVTHNLRDAVKYGNRLVMIHRGKIVFDVCGTAKNLLTTELLLNLFHEYEDRYLAGEEQ